MFVIIISLLFGAVAFSLFFLKFGVIASFIPALAIAIGLFFFLSLKMGRKIEQSMKDIQVILGKGKIDEGILKLKDIKTQYGKWQIFLSSSIDGQIGSIYYMQSKFSKAKPYLEKAFVRHWIAKAMLAVVYYREKNYQKMDEEFQQVTKINKKSGLLWSLWAYCHWRLGNNKKAREILVQGNGHLNGQDPILKDNLLSLQNNKRMKMKGYKEHWYQFLLEVSPGQNLMRQGRVRFQNK